MPIYFSLSSKLHQSIVSFTDTDTNIHIYISIRLFYCMDEQYKEMTANSSLENMISSKTQEERKSKPQPDQQPQKCPRCDSTNTKFCYYNNYSLTQPRYFCKSCRRYWTKGGTLRNVPVGGGCRKNKRSSSSAKKTLDQYQPLNFPSFLNGQLGFGDNNNFTILGNPRFIETQKNLSNCNNNFNEIIYGYGGEVENGGGCGEMGMNYEEYCNGMENENRVLWGFPRQINGDGNMGDISATSWHGLLNI